MFKFDKTGVIKRSSTEVTRYVNGIDIFNSKLLRELGKITEFSEYPINKYEGRYDLISQDIYETTELDWLLTFLNRLPSTQLVRGVTLKYITQKQFNDLVNTL